MFILLIIYVIIKTERMVFMNIPSLLIPKGNITYLHTKDSIEFALSVFRQTSYTAVPVINSDGMYRGTLTEGDLLYYIMDNPDSDLKKVKVRNILRQDFYEAVKITASVDKLLIKVLDQNFVPVVDDRNIFVGIVTRKVIFKQIYEEQLKIKYGA